ncbi:PREDICTED: uncharacterized protein C11orf70 homolog [Ceratosolen solmsi marchali]|uniref:Cilia- and flagella-associated protein 300 n=2 Tax=Ceratosolen solmsi marchali TaxID=326594 RepID=A0AAJ6YUE7_9HYME|nr:PREDICTED: uncharacterized protein C11orf70 homolog [Ceratosolen solmsi marchali]
MDLDPKYTFTPLLARQYMGIDNKDTQDYFRKWGIHGNIGIQNFSFNEEFQPYNKYQIAEAFFKDDIVVKSLLHKDGDSWINKSIKAECVEVCTVACTILDMSFFDKLMDPENKIVFNTGKIRQRYETVVDDFVICDNLRGMLLDTECPEYNLFTDEERQEFIFRIFELLVLGGVLCQFENEIKPYLDITRSIYKDLITVQLHEQGQNLSIGTTVLQVVAKNSQGEAFFPTNSELRQNIGFLLIDGLNRQITTFLHQFGSFHW